MLSLIGTQHVLMFFVSVEPRNIERPLPFLTSIAFMVAFVGDSMLRYY